MSAPHQVFQAKPGKSKVPDPTKQTDRHTQLAGLLLKAELAPDSLERMLAVCRQAAPLSAVRGVLRYLGASSASSDGFSYRFFLNDTAYRHCQVLLCWLTDLMRPGRGFQDMPVVTLGFHALSHRDMAERYKGDPTRVYLQEGVLYEAHGPTQHDKYLQGGVALAALKLAFSPVCSVKTHKGGLLGGAGPPYLECALEGSGELELDRHAEQYTFTLPALLFEEPLAVVAGHGVGCALERRQECPLDLDGALSIRCPATGLSAELRFKPQRGGAVKGAVLRMFGEGSTKVAAVKGSWKGAVEVEGLESEGAGVLFEASQCSPPLLPAINLAQPGPRAAPRLWAAILQAVTFVDAGQALKEGGRKAEQVALAVPRHLKGSLGYEVEEGLVKPAGEIGASAEQEEQGPVGSAGAGAPLRFVPPCIEAQAQAGRRPHYFLRHLVQVLRDD
ncbi:hypothetical protein N2152v2_003401 [Parachlorella kessleri]